MFLSSQYEAVHPLPAFGSPQLDGDVRLLQERLDQLIYKVEAVLGNPEVLVKQSTMLPKPALSPDKLM